MITEQLPWGGSQPVLSETHLFANLPDCVRVRLGQDLRAAIAVAGDRRVDVVA
eukprot:COSAG04_NODE_24459_length_321_cov_1.405405_2_plen_52_part_01